MNAVVAYEDAVDLLDADHKAVKKMFIDYSALCEEQADPMEKQKLAQRICQALDVHAQIEEEMFYPKVREAIADDALMDEAINEHAEAKKTIAVIRNMKAPDDKYDAAVKKLGKLIDQHVSEEREVIFLKARNAALDLRGMAVTLFTRKKQLQKAVPSSKKEAA